MDSAGEAVLKGLHGLSSLSMLSSGSSSVIAANDAELMLGHLLPTPLIGQQCIFGVRHAAAAAPQCTRDHTRRVLNCSTLEGPLGAKCLFEPSTRMTTYLKRPHPITYKVFTRCEGLPYP